MRGDAAAANLLRPQHDRKRRLKAPFPFFHVIPYARGNVPDNRTFMSETATYILAGVALCFANTTAWVATWFGLPGTWVIVALTALACHFFPSSGSLGLSWMTVGVLAGM